MKTFLRVLFVQLFICLTNGVFSRLIPNNGILHALTVGFAPAVLQVLMYFVECWWVRLSIIIAEAGGTFLLVIAFL